MSHVIPISQRMHHEKQAVYDLAKTLHQTHYEKLCIKAEMILAGPTDVEDAVQEAFVAFLELPAPPKGNAASYIASILRRVCLDRLAERSVERRIRDESAIELGDGNRWLRGVREDFSLSNHAYVSDQRTAAPRERRRRAKTRNGNQTR